MGDEFALFNDWSECYQHLIELGRTAEHIVSGCHSQVWLDIGGDALALEIRAASDAGIVLGL